MRGRRRLLFLLVAGLFVLPASAVAGVTIFIVSDDGSTTVAYVESGSVRIEAGAADGGTAPKVAGAADPECVQTSVKTPATSSPATASPATSSRSSGSGEESEGESKGSDDEKGEASASDDESKGDVEDKGSEDEKGEADASGSDNDESNGEDDSKAEDEDKGSDDDSKGEDEDKGSDDDSKGEDEDKGSEADKGSDEAKGDESPTATASPAPTSASPSAPPASAPRCGAARPASAASAPAAGVQLGDWRLQLPEGEAEHPDEITEAELPTYQSKWFQRDGAGALWFRAPVNGVTTKGSKNPRSELREMTDGERAAWKTTEGTSTMVIDQAITKLPEGKPQIVAGQIHGEDDDLTVFRLEGTTLYVTNGDHKKDWTVIDEDYQLGTRFEAKYVVSGGKIEAYYQGKLVATMEITDLGSYFKAGAYVQANCGNTKPCSSDNLGEVVIYGLSATHAP